MPFLKKSLMLLLANILLIAALIYLTETVLFFLDQKRLLPYNGWRNGQYFTWGIPVKKNSFHFREREILTPKPAGVIRIMVLGDSLTFGVGLETAQRYTELTEQELHRLYPGRKFEVLNFGMQGGATVAEVEHLKKYFLKTEPNLIVVGFCINDTQPRNQDYSVEREAFLLQNQSLFSFIESLKDWGLKYLAQRLQKLILNYAEKNQLIPDWKTALDRTYQEESAEWQTYLQALREVVEISRLHGLPSPVFAALNQSSSDTLPTDYANPDPTLKTLLGWLRKAESAARSAGFTAYNHEQEIINQLGKRVMSLNQFDGHPNSDLNLIYAFKLSKIIAGYLEQGKLGN